MEILGTIAIIFVGLLAFSLLGWGLKVLGWIIDFLGEGCSTSWGCLIWIIAIIIGVAFIKKRVFSLNFSRRVTILL